MDNKTANAYKIDVLNSLAWFGMDALWMMEFHRTAYIMGIPTLVTGVLAIVYAFNRTDRLVNTSILFWIMMNISWLLSELYPIIKELHVTIAFFLLASTFLLVAWINSDNNEAVFSRFRKARLLLAFTKKDR
jgi:uncharacterized membrane protein HdeD (DUF308 family)